MLLFFVYVFFLFFCFVSFVSEKPAVPTDGCTVSFSSCISKMESMSVETNLPMTCQGFKCTGEGKGLSILQKPQPLLTLTIHQLISFL